MGLAAAPSVVVALLLESPVQRRISGIHHRAVLLLRGTHWPKISVSRPRRTGPCAPTGNTCRKRPVPPAVVPTAPRLRSMKTVLFPVGHRLRSVGHPDMPAPDDLSVLHQGDQRVAPAFADREENIAGGRVEGDPKRVLRSRSTASRPSCRPPSRSPARI